MARFARLKALAAIFNPNTTNASEGRIASNPTSPATPNEAAGQVTIGAAPPKPPGFQPRTGAHERLNQAWEQGPVQLLHGESGVGKTQLAADVLRHSTAQVRMWIPATTLDTLIAGYAQAAKTLKLVPARTDQEAAAQALTEWFGNDGRNTSWLLVLDGLDLAPAEMHPWWPPAEQPTTSTHRVIVTSPRADSYQSPGRLPVPLLAYTPEEALAYLTDRLADADVGNRLPHDALSAAPQLAEALQYHPVALAQAAAVIHEDTHGDPWTCASYLTEYQQTNVDLERLSPTEAALEPGQHAVAVTWQIAIARAQRDHPWAAAAADLAGYTDPNGAPEPLWETPSTLSYLKSAPPPDNDERSANADQATGITTEPGPTQARIAIEALARYALITINPNDSSRAIRIHELVQRAIRRTHTARRHDLVCATLAEALLEMWPDPEPDDQLAQALRDNTFNLERLWNPIYQPEHNGVLFRAGRSLGESGNPAAAVGYFEHLHAQIQQRLGPDHPDTLIARGTIARWRGAVGDIAGAITDYERLLHEQTRILGPDHPNILTTRSNLAQLRGDIGDIPTAISDYQQLLQDQTRILGPAHPDTLGTRGSLAGLRGETGDVASAITDYQQLLPDQTRVLGADHPDTLVTRGNLARHRGDTGDPTAITDYERLLDDQTRILGADHLNTLITRSNLARVRGETGDFATSITDYQRLLPDQTRILGPDHPHTLLTRSNLVELRGATGDIAGAITDCQQLLQDETRVLGADHPDTLITRRILARLRDRTGDHRP